MKPIRFVTIFLATCMVGFLLNAGNIFAAVSILKATGGTISADKATNASVPAWTTLGNIRLTEGAITDFSVGTNVTVIVNAPTGWQFNTAAAVTVSHVNGRDISASSVLSKTASAITIQITVSGFTKTDILTIAAIQIRANDGANVPGTTNLTRSGTATINGCAAGANLGDLAQSVGAAYRIVTVLPGLTLTDGTTLAGSGVTGTATSQIAGTAFTITRLTVCDQFYNRVTTYSGAKTISYTGPSNGLTAPSFTTAVNFTSGNSTTALTTTLKKAETTTITATDGTIAGLTTSNLVVNPGAVGNFQVEAAAGGNIGSQIAGTSFNIKVSAFDLENNPCTSGPNSYTGTVNITSTGNLSAGSGITPAFVAGVLASHSVTISNTGTFNITATKTSDTETGTSNSFVVNPGVLNNFLVEAETGGNIGTQVVDTAFTIKITARDVNNNACNSGPNNFTGTVDVTSTGTLTSGGGSTPSFTAGVLASRIVTISNAGTFTITATKTSGSESGISNSFDVVTAPILTGISPECVTTGGSSFTITVNGNNFNGTSIVRINGSNRATTFLSINQLQATILASDISSDGTDIIDVQNPPPGAGTSTGANLIASNIPSISPEPSGVTICDDSLVVFSASVTGYQMSYQWMKNGIPVSNGGHISGATTPTLTFNPASISDTSSFYYLAVSTYCHPNVYSDTVQLRMTGHTSSTANISICQGQSYTPPGGSAQTTSGTYITTIPNANGCDSTITTNLTVIPNTASTANISICQGQSYTPPGGSAETTSGTYITTIPNAAGCDSVITTNLTVILNTASTANISICQGQSYTPPGGSAETTSGTYITTIPNAAGCDSVITTNLTVIPNTASTANISICQGQSYTPPGGTAQTTSGTYLTTIPNAAGCDSVITTNLTVIPNTASTANISICQGQSYTPPGGSAQTTSGTYITTIPNAAGCDSVITTNLTVIPNTASTANISICQGQSYTPPGGSAETTSGTYITTIPNAAGCDSVITTNLTVIPNTTSTANITICSGNSYTPPGGTAQTTSGTYITTIPNAAGCDSTITTNLSVVSFTTSTANISICDGQSYTPPGGSAETTSGTYVTTIPNAGGCDSIITTNLTVMPHTTSTANISICQGQSYTPPGGSAETTSGTYITTIPNANGCDSTITTNLTVIPNTASTANISICQGQSYTPPGGSAETTSGTYITTIPNTAGCDSVITTNLTVIPSTSSTVNISICQGQSYTPPGGSAQTTSGTYITTIPNAAGCDSVITTNLTVIPNTASTANISICQGQSYTPPGGSAQTTSGTYITTIPNAAGCDSVITTNLTVIPNTSSTANISICQGQSYTPPGGSAQTTSGTYITTISNAAGCDSVITTNLTVIPNTASTANISICQGQSYTPPGGSAQTTSGTYITMIPNAAGCDSVITTNLTVIPNTASTANISICQGQSYTPPGGTAQTTSGTYITTIPNAAGCDSVITTNLTVIPNTASTANISICQGQSYTPPGGSAQTTSGTYITTIPNAAGCDSVITTNLTVIPNTASTANISICQGQSYTPPGGSAETTSGSYITTIPNAAGCDSVITTNLTVIPNTASTANISICQGQSYTPPGGTAQTTSGTYITTIPNAAGCDSVITTNLTVIPNTASTANITICSGNSYTPPGGTAQTTSGTYITTIPNAAGCDSTITTNLSVVAAVSSIQNIDLCLGDSLTLPDNSVVYPTVNTTYYDTVPSVGVPGCDSLITINVAVNSLPLITATPTQIQCLVTTGSVSLSTSNGTPGYTYSGSDTVNLAAGTYTYIVTDSKGCKDTTTATINSAPTTLTFSASPVQIRCYGMRGSVTLNTSGGVTPYTFGGDTTAGLFAGTYNYTVTDANGCSANASVTINAAPPQLIHTATATQIQCYGGKGSVSLSTSGGTPPYTFSGSPTTNLSAGTYNYTVTDSKGCVSSTSALIAPAPAKLVGIITTTMTRCDSNTGTAGVSVTGGSAPFTFLWNTVPAQTTPLATGLANGTYTVLITDGHGCTATASKAVTKATSTAITITGKNVSCPGELTSLCATNGLVSYSWNTGETTRCMNANAAGVYTVTATNINGCTSSASKTLTAGTTPAVAITGNDYLCPSGSVSLCASPGLTTYTWNNGLRAQCRTVNAGGTYSVTVTNISGCTASASHTVKPAMTLGTNVTNGICANGFLGSVNVAVTGQSAPYTYLWNNGATTTGITGLGAGQYIVQVTDDNGCTATAATNVAITKTTADYSTVNSSFMNYGIAAGNYIWFNAAVKVNYTGSYPLTLYFTNQNIKSTKFNINSPNSKLVLTNAVSQATTTFNGTEWVTTAPPNIAGNYFISGYAYQVPLAITANLNPVTWKGIWTASCPGVSSVEWKWSAAVYTGFTTSLDSVEVKPVDSSTDSQYLNNDLAGSPENYKANLIAGARSTGGTNYTGSYSVTGNKVPCSPSICNPNARIGNFSEKSKELDTDIVKTKQLSEEKTLSHKAYPNPFTSSVTIEMERSGNSSNTTIEIYDFKGQKISTLFDEFIDPKVKYTVEFNGESLPGGVYIYKIISGDEMVNGKLILKK